MKDSVNKYGCHSLKYTISLAGRIQKSVSFYYFVNQKIFIADSQNMSEKSFDP